MNQDSVKSTFMDRIRNAGASLETLTPYAAIDLMLNFYDNDAVEGFRNEGGGDMLLYQWGTYDWGEGESFEFDITRQLIFGDGEDEDIFQLSLTFKFVPTNELRQLASGNRWCSSREKLEGFRNFIHHSAPFLRANEQLASSVQLEYGIAG